MNKPRKPLSSLFTKTEAKPEPKKAPVQAAPKKVDVTPHHKPEPKAPEAKVKEIKAPEPVVVAAPAPVPAPIVAKPVTVSATPEEFGEQLAHAIRNLQDNFEKLESTRNIWSQDQYTNFIRRLDVAQTEAFFLKGKLLQEVKNKFYEESKQGWKSYCEETLRLNYTTANQYIRVAQEFDVTSHQRRPEFGFEHFKALLPLPLDMRKELIDTLPQVSVKKLRTIVHEKMTVQSDSGNHSDAKQALKAIQKLGDLIQQGSFHDLPQSLKWQLSAASHSIAEDLRRLSSSLMSPSHSIRPGASAFPSQGRNNGEMNT